MRAVTFNAPTDDLFAGVQVEASPDGQAWRVVGAHPAFALVNVGTADEPHLVPEPNPAPTVDCKLTADDTTLRCIWSHYDAARGVEHVGPLALDGKPRARRRLGGS